MNTHPNPSDSPDALLEPDISYLQRRLVQAPIAARLIRAFARVVGHQEALRIAAEAFREDAREGGAALAGQLGANDIDRLSRVVRDTWAQDGALEIRWLEQTDQRLSFDVTRCRYAELYRDLGAAELGSCLSCCRDESFAAGFNPELKLARTQTIMQGASFCDFRFVLTTAVEDL